MLNPPSPPQKKKEKESCGKFKVSNFTSLSCIFLYRSIYEFWGVNVVFTSVYFSSYGFESEDK